MTPGEKSIVLKGNYYMKKFGICFSHEITSDFNIDSLNNKTYTIKTDGRTVTCRGVLLNKGEVQ